MNPGWGGWDFDGKKWRCCQRRSCASSLRFMCLKQCHINHPPTIVNHIQSPSLSCLIPQSSHPITIFIMFKKKKQVQKSSGHPVIRLVYLRPSTLLGVSTSISFKGRFFCWISSPGAILIERKMGHVHHVHHVTWLVVWRPPRPEKWWSESIGMIKIATQYEWENAQIDGNQTTNQTM